MLALVALLIILLVFGAGGFALHVLWWVLIAAVIIWLLGFAVGPRHTTPRRWYW